MSKHLNKTKITAFAVILEKPHTETVSDQNYLKIFCSNETTRFLLFCKIPTDKFIQKDLQIDTKIYFEANLRNTSGFDFESTENLLHCDLEYLNLVEWE